MNPPQNGTDRPQLVDSPRSIIRGESRIHEETFDPVMLLSTAMGLFAFVVVWESVGALIKGARVYEKWGEQNPPKIDDSHKKFMVEG